MEKIPVKARAESRLKDGSVNFIIEADAGSVAMLMTKLTIHILQMMKESFGAEDWDEINILISRSKRDGTA